MNCRSMAVLVLILVAVVSCNTVPAQEEQGTAPQAATPAPTAAPKPVPAELPQVVARVNGEDVPKDALLEAVRAVEGRSGGPVPPDQRDALYRNSLEQLISFRLLLQESKTRKLAVSDAEVEQRLAGIRQQFPDEEAFKGALAQEGLTPERLAVTTRESLIAQKLVDAEVPEAQTVGETEVQRFYDETRDQYFKEAESVRASHILIRVADEATPEAKAKAKGQAEDLLVQVKGGGDFADLARKHSQDPGSAPRGGDLGFFAKGQMVPPFETAAFALEPGETSSVVESPFGFHIIRLAERKPERTVPLPEVSGKIREHLGRMERDKKVQQFLEGLRAKGEVEVLI